MKKKIIIFAVLTISIILALVLIFVLVDRRRTDDNKNLTNDKIKKISLVYWYTNHCGMYNEAYLIDPDGTVFKFNYVRQQDDHINEDSQKFLEDLLKNIDSENYANKHRTANVFSNETKKLLNSIKYDSINLEYESNSNDAGGDCYYCLVEYEDFSKLVKIKETGETVSTSKNPDIDKICTYINIVLMLKSCD